MPQRLAEALCGEAGVSERRLAELRRAERTVLLDKLTEYPLECDGHEGYAKVKDHCLSMHSFVLLLWGIIF